MNQKLNPDVMNFIEAQQKVQEAKNSLFQTECHARDCARALTQAFFAENSEIKATFVAYHGGQFYLIRVDTDGDNGHRIERIDGVMGLAPDHSTSQNALPAWTSCNGSIEDMLGY